MRFFSTLLASALGTLVAGAVLVFIGFLFITALIASTSSPPATVRAGSVLEVSLTGAVPELVSSDPFDAMLGISPSHDLVGLKNAIRAAAEDERIEGIWLQANGVATSWATLQEIRDALEEFKESGKPIIASSDERMITERDYFLASVADEIYAGPGAIFEFNGLYAQSFFYKDMLDKLGVEPTIIRAGSYKSAVEPFTRTNMSSESRAQLSALLYTHNEALISAVAESREVTPEYVESLMRDDAFITTDDGFAAGMLDSLLFDQDVEEIFKDHLGLSESAEFRSVSLSDYITDAPRSSSGGTDAIGVVYAVGPITSGESVGANSVGSTTFNNAIKRIRENDRVKAMVLRINSPGGSALASEAMWQEINKTAEEMPVIVSMGGVAASGGYWLATAGDTIVADPTTITGSIGVFGMHFSVGDMFDSKLGITTDQVTTSAYADMFSGFRPLRAPEQALLGRLIESTYDDFLELVATNRGMTIEEVHQIAQGRVWTGKDAMEIGLVDVMGGIDAAIALAAEEAGLEPDSYSLVRGPRPKSFLEELENALMVRIAKVLNIAPTEHTEVLRRIEEAVQMQGVPQARMPLDIEIQ